MVCIEPAIALLSNDKSRLFFLIAARLKEARILIEGLVEPHVGLHFQAERWLHGLPLNSDAPLRLNHHPVTGQWVYGYNVNETWIGDPRLSACGHFAVNPYRTYAITNKEINTLDRANRQLANMLQLAQLAKTLPKGSTEQIASADKFFDAVRVLLDDTQRKRLKSLEQQGTTENIDRAIRLLCQE